MKNIAYSRPDGSLSLVIPVEPMRSGETETQYLARIRARAEEANPLLKAFTFQGHVEPEVPLRKFRDAWRVQAGRIVVDPVKKDEILWTEVRAERDRRLAESDMKRKVSEDLNDGKAALWRKYQQDLRDIPQTQTDPENIVWPTEP